MKVSTTEPFQLIYSLFEHEYLGHLMGAYAVQLNARGELTLRHQTVSGTNVHEFAAALQPLDYELVAHCDAMQQEAVVKAFWPRKIAVADFFLRTYHPDTGPKPLQEALARHVQTHRAAVLAGLTRLASLNGRRLFAMGRDGEPTWREIALAPAAASVLFHFRRNADGTHYFPTIQYQSQRLDFQYQDALLINLQPAWLLLRGTLYTFRTAVDGRKLLPFLAKKFIVVPRAVEASYFEKFVAPLMEAFEVHARGFDVRTERYLARPRLAFSDAALALPAPAPAPPVGPPRRGRVPLPRPAPTTGPAGEALVHFELSFSYGPHAVPLTDEKPLRVRLEKTGDSYVFHRLIRNSAEEAAAVTTLAERGLPVAGGRAALPAAAAFAWLAAHAEALQALGFVVESAATAAHRYFVGPVRAEVGIVEAGDWFDVRGTVWFGSFAVPFVRLRGHILQRRRAFELPDGQVAILPEAWFEDYRALFALAETRPEGLALRRHQVALVADLHEAGLATAVMGRKLARLRDGFADVAAHALPAGFRGTLRPYQQAGYDWLRFVQGYGFGGCLADEMGLGKTVMTLALLLQRAESGAAAGAASLLVLPTSLVFNWQAEARQFAPGLRVLAHTGPARPKTTAHFGGYDLILTTYGTVRLDADLLAAHAFDYVVLDEAQAIKNPGSTTAQAVLKLHARHRLVLTGTPVENSSLDLWSQMSFLNPGLLGTEAFFRKEFLKPIEGRADAARTARLHALVRPFILRRHKAQVAPELPAKTEQLVYCPLTDEQAEAYAEARDFYRAQLLQTLAASGLKANGNGKPTPHHPTNSPIHQSATNPQLLLLQGLTRLRQLANHPRLVDATYAHESGKLREVLRMLRQVVAEGHKVLVFSQFVQHLALVRAALDERRLPYAYLDGSTRAPARAAEVARFQATPALQIFLISLKAGGTGLNLTAADYVFVLDPWWNPAVEAQATGRAHRIGQQRPVFVYKFISQGTVEEKIVALQRRKQALVADLIGTDEAIAQALTRADIEELLA